MCMHTNLTVTCRGAGQQSVSSLDDVEEALLQQPLASGLIAEADDTSLAEPVPDQYISSDRTGDCNCSDANHAFMHA